MPSEPIRYWHRAKKTVETEQIYGERWLRWVYEIRSGGWRCGSSCGGRSFRTSTAGG